MSEDTKNRLYLGTVFLLVAFMCLVPGAWTAWQGWAWHVRHGNFARFEGRSIRIPWDMWAVSSGDSALTILRDAPKYPIFRSPSGILVFTRTPGPRTDMSKNYDSIARANEQASHDVQLLGIREISARKGKVYCWESANSDQSKIVISCWFDNDTLSASYAGTPVYRNEFYEAVSLLAGSY